MFSTSAHTRASGEQPNEDWYAATDGLVVVLDGATIRTDTGCVHGLPWYVHQLGAAIISAAQDRRLELAEVLRQAIEQVAGLHRDTCDLNHEGTPSAAVGIARHNEYRLEWLSLGDITVLVDTATDHLHVTSDNRVSLTATPERHECDRHLLGTDAKLAAILAMKPVELNARNVEGGYWIASVNPDAARHAYTGTTSLADVRQYAVCSDGAMRALDLTAISTHAGVLGVLRRAGPEFLIDQVRTAERHDPHGARVPRNKATDDATAVHVERTPTQGDRTVSEFGQQAALDSLTARSRAALMGEMVRT